MFLLICRLVRYWILCIFKMTKVEKLDPLKNDFFKN